MHCLQRLTRWHDRALALTLAGSLTAACSAGGGKTETAPPPAPSDGVSRTANGQIILDPAAAAQPLSAGNGADLAPDVSAALPAPAEAQGAAGLSLDPRADAGANPGSVPDDESSPAPVEPPSAEPAAPPEEEEEEEDD